MVLATLTRSSISSFVVVPLPISWFFFIDSAASPYRWFVQLSYFSCLFPVLTAQISPLRRVFKSDPDPIHYYLCADRGSHVNGWSARTRPHGELSVLKELRWSVTDIAKQPPHMCMFLSAAPSNHRKDQPPKLDSSQAGGRAVPQREFC